MARIRVRVTTAPRGPDFPTEGDDALAAAMLTKVLRVAARGALPPALVLVGADEVRVVYVAPLLQATKDHHSLIASFAGLPGVEAVALLGRFTQRQRDRAARHLAGVFVEWTDGRWWASWQPVDENGRLIPTDEEELLRAVDGQPRPSGLGGWYSRARFQGLRIDLTPEKPAPVMDDA
jgi:hypothetical protein